MTKPLSRDALPYQPKTTQQITKPPPPPPPPPPTQPAVAMVVSPAGYYYHYYCYNYRKQEEQLAAYLYSQYYNAKSQPQPHPFYYSLSLQPTASESPNYGVILGGSGEKELLETYRVGEVKKNDSDGGPTKFCGGKRWRVLVGRGKRGGGPRWKPKSCKYAGGCVGGGGGGGGGGGVNSDDNLGWGKTTVMIKNIPNQLRRKMLVEFLDNLCVDNHLEYDFLYLPMDFVRGNNYGYAFVNFTSASAARRIMELLQGHKWGCIQTDRGSFLSHKICEMTWAKIQGRDALVQNFQNSTFGCNTSEWLPVVFSPPRNGLNSISEQRNIGKCRAPIS